MQSEIWKLINFADGRFEVSNFGRVRNTRTKRIRPTNNRAGYLRVRIERKMHAVHRLVAVAFLQPDPNRPFVNHVDGNKANNNASNLEWTTHAENVSHAYAIGLIKPKRGSSNGASKLTEDEVREIRRKYANGDVRQVDLAAEYGCNQHNISLIVRREKWAHV